MPRTIRYTKNIGSLKPGDTEERSDIDANILTTLGVAEEITEKDIAVSENRAMVAAPLSSSKKGKKRKKQKAGEESRKGYRRRDMTTERRP